MLIGLQQGDSPSPSVAEADTAASMSEPCGLAAASVTSASASCTPKPARVGEWEGRRAGAAQCQVSTAGGASLHRCTCD